MLDQAFKFHWFGSIYDLAGQGKVKINIVAPAFFACFMATTTSFLLNNFTVRNILSQIAFQPQSNIRLSLQDLLDIATLNSTTCFSRSMMRNICWN
jgi:hypothetical protein